MTSDGYEATTAQEARSSAAAPKANDAKHLALGELVRAFDPELSDRDHARYDQVVSVDLSAEQEQRIVNPDESHPTQREVLALHWHPEFIPIPLIHRRVDALFPNREAELLIPTQHNVLESYDGQFTGVEVDCYSPEFNRKVQLLMHVESARLDSPRAAIFKNMLAHTFKYRGGQLYDFFDTLLKPVFEERLQRAASDTGATEELVRYVTLHSEKLLRLHHENLAKTPAVSIKNKLIRDYFNALRAEAGDHVIDRAQVFLKAVKQIVKSHFNLEYFYKTREVIDEVRMLGGGIVIPHPEQFWPILLADYDVDGYEVWNPQSREYTEFLINVVHRHNQQRRNSRRLLVLMGDDCHLGEKVKDPRFWDKEKAFREVGVQPAWNDMAICKSLIFGSFSRRSVMDEYRQRLLDS